MDTVDQPVETTSQERHGCDGFQKHPLPCAKCGIVPRDSNSTKSTYYWETMNFCSDLCVGNYLIDIGARCAVCTDRVPWGSLGKYCVRFGSDVRQFCSARCLEAYKNETRVCFHCQLDVKEKLNSVILANIPAATKTTPKEFCSQDCVDMYMEQYLGEAVGPRSNTNSRCTVCAALKTIYRELVVLFGAPGSYPICSEVCWSKLLETKNVPRPVKCEICSKFINSELRLSTSASPHHFSTQQKVYGFCSARCKNVYVHKSRRILPCRTCKVRKYSHDLIENASPAFPVCSLNCILENNSASQECILNLRESYLTSVVKIEGEVFCNKSGQLLQSQGEDALESWSGAVNDVSEEEMNSLIMGAESCLVFPPSEPAVQKNKGCLVRPIVVTLGTQFGSSQVSEVAPLDERFKVKDKGEGEKYIPIFIPVFIPFPFYALDAPVPIPLPVPIPVHIPIPVPLPLPIVIPVESKTTAGDPPSLPIMTPIHSNVNTASVIPSPEQLDLPGPGPNNVAESDADNSSDILILNTLRNLEVNLGSGSVVEDLASPVPEMLWSEPSSALDTIPSHPSLSREECALQIWTKYFGETSDPVRLSEKSLNDRLVELVQAQTETYPSSGERLPPFMILYLCLGLQKYLRTKNRPRKLFYDLAYESFGEAFMNYVEITYRDQAGPVEPVVDEKHFWEALELGSNGPEVLVFTLVYYNYKYFQLRTWQEHSSLRMTDYTLTNRTCTDGAGTTTSKKLSLRRGDGGASQSVDEMALTDKCFIKLFEFYKLKSTISNSGPLYKEILPRSLFKAKWYGAEPLSQMDIYRMLIRAMLIKG